MQAHHKKKSEYAQVGIYSVRMLPPDEVARFFTHVAKCRAGLNKEPKRANLELVKESEVKK